MPVPKRKHSNSRTGKRRANWKLTAPNLVQCSTATSPACRTGPVPIADTTAAGKS